MAVTGAPTRSPPPTLPPPPPGLPWASEADYQPGLGLLLVLSGCCAVCLAGCALCRLHRQQRRDEHRGAGALCCECAVLFGSGEAHATEATAHNLSVWAGRARAVADSDGDGRGARRPNLPAQRVQVAGASGMDELEMAVDSDIAARLRRWQTRALDEHVGAAGGDSAHSDFTPRTEALFHEHQQDQARQRVRAAALTPEEQFVVGREQAYST